MGKEDIQNTKELKERIEALNKTIKIRKLVLNKMIEILKKKNQKENS